MQARFRPQCPWCIDDGFLSIRTQAIKTRITITTIITIITIVTIKKIIVTRIGIIKTPNRTTLTIFTRIPRIAIKTTPIIITRITRTAEVNMISA